MKKERKIFLDRSEGLDAAVDKIIHTPVDTIILNIPKGSVLGLSPNNFRVLKRESETAGKILTIESVDDDILDLANLAKINALNPILNTRERTVSDIVRNVPLSRRGVLRKEGVGAKKESSEKEEIVIKKRGIVVERELHKEILAHEPEEEIYQDEKPRARSLRGGRGWMISFSIFALIFLVGGWYSYREAPHVSVEITLKKAEVPVNLTIQVSKDYHEVGFQNNTILIPGELLEAKSNLSMDFPAQGTEVATARAKGKLTVHNAFSSSPQGLVASTRFESPSGKIFRLDKAVLIPGAKVVSGKMVPSSIEVNVTADAEGPDYNNPKEGQWTIPGFKNTAKFKGFYGEASGLIEGGFSGERAVVSSDDLTNAEKKVGDALRAALESQMLLLKNEAFKAVEGNTEFVILKKETQPNAEDKKIFGMFLEGRMRQLVFEEKTLNEALATAIGKNRTGERVAETKVEYGTPTFDFEKGTMSFNASGTLVFVANVDAEGFKTSILGADETAVRTAVWALPGIETAKASFSPFWVHRAPMNPVKVNVTIQ
ncbi:MAG: hypothetical protein WCW78_02280 [Candidatus Paceibacterota bacterium]|jgi:hypothetical protein